MVNYSHDVLWIDALHPEKLNLLKQAGGHLKNGRLIETIVEASTVNLCSSNHTGQMLSNLHSSTLLSAPF